MKITLLTFGSRGDVQPYLALALALRERGHEVMLIAPNDLEEHFKAFAIPYTLIPLGVKDMDVADKLIKQGFSFKTMIAVVRELLPQLKRALYSAVQIAAEAARNADLLIAHGFLLAFAYSLHQHLKIPLMLGIAAPIIATREFPSPQFPALPFAQTIYNPFSYEMTVRFVTSFMMEPANQYRQEIGLPKIAMRDLLRILFGGEFPMLMHYSRHLMPTIPPDWKNVHVVGAWKMPPQNDWTPPEKLSAFLAQGEPPVFIGFGSMPVGKPEEKSKMMSEALHIAGVRGILQAGWGRLAHEDAHLITIGDAPHDWLFPRMSAIVHHGGSGTTHSAAAAGKPALIVPFNADQPFWGKRIAELGIGVPPIVPRKLNAPHLADALRTLTQDAALRQRAAEMGELLRAEDGIAVTCALLERYAAQQ